MIEIVINYDPQEKHYKIYEPSTQNLIVSQNLTEALTTLNTFLCMMGMIQGSILTAEEISYHLDFWSMKAIIESNAALIKRLQSAPSGFTISGQKFGSSSGLTTKKKEKSDWGAESRKKFKSGNFSGNNGFKQSYKKFGSKNQMR